MSELAAELNRLAGTTGLYAQGAANVLNGTKGVELVKCMNALAGTSNLAFNGAIKAYAALHGGDSFLEANGALVGTTLGPTFSPPNLRAWVDPDEIAGDNVAVSSYTPAIAGTAFTQATGANQPLIIANALDSHKALRFDGVNDYLVQASGTLYAQPNTLAIVAKSNLAAGYHFWIDGVVQREGIYCVGSQARFFAGSEQSYGTIDANPHLFVVIFNGASSKMWVDGGVGVVANPNTLGLSGLTLGTDQTLGAYVNGDIYWAAWSSSAWDATNLADLRTWVNYRWPSITVGAFS